MIIKKLTLKNIDTIFFKKHDLVSCNKSQQIALAKRFFPFYMLKIKYIINAVYKIHPKTSFLLIIKLFSVAIRRKLSANAKAFYRKGLKKELKIEGSTFYTYSYGNGPLILMLHGWCSNGARWRVYVNDLVNSGYKVVVVDAPGHGTAPGKFLSIFLYAKGIKAILKSEPKWHTIITHSIAGLTAMAAIGNSHKKHHPSKYIMMNTFANATNILEKFSFCLGISKNVIEGVKEQLSKNTDFSLNEFSIEKHYEIINEKGLLIYDTTDKVVPIREAKYLINTIHSLEVIKTEGLGHNLKSHEVVKKVLNFVNTQVHHKTELEKIALCL